MTKQKIVFIAYADEKMAYSLKRIGKQAKSLLLFDEIILYTPHDLPQYIKESPLMQFSYGGGYWAWKPCIINETLKNHEEGTIVCYIDAGCTLNSSPEWELYTELMKEKDFLCFKYRDEMPEWEKFGSTSTLIKHWTKKESILFYNKWTGDDKWSESNKVLGGCIWAKGKNNRIIKDWLNITLNYPNIIMDPKKNDEQYPFFAQHKHDQSLLTALTYKYKNDCWILPELCETYNDKTAIKATRIRAKTRNDFYKILAKNLIRNIIGPHNLQKLKNILN